MIVAPQGPFGGNRKQPVIEFAQTDFITFGIQTFTASATKRWHQILGGKWHGATLQGIKLSGWSDSTMTLGQIDIKCYSSKYGSTGAILAETALAVSGVNQQNLADAKLYEKWAIQIAATTDTLANKTNTVFWKDFTDAQKRYSLEVYDQLYVTIAVVFSGGNFIDVNPQLEVMPFLAD